MRVKERVWLAIGLKQNMETLYRLFDSLSATPQFCVEPMWDRIIVQLARCLSFQHNCRREVLIGLMGLMRLQR